MTLSSQPTSSDRDLVFERVIDAPPEKLFRAWTEPDLLKQWFTPRPWTVSFVETDVRPGGASLIVMRNPEGQEFPHRGVYLEVVENKCLVFTDAYINAWTPSEKPFMTASITFERVSGKTKYTARVLHWSAADREDHEKKGGSPRLVAGDRPACCSCRHSLTRAPDRPVKPVSAPTGLRRSPSRWAATVILERLRTPLGEKK